jgi:hypothetical protein
MTELLKIYTTHSLSEAYMMKSLLEGNGVQCFMRDENVIRINPLYSGPLGGIRLEVLSSQAEEAKNIISAYTGVPWEKDGVGKLSPFDVGEYNNNAKKEINKPKIYWKNVVGSVVIFSLIASMFNRFIFMITLIAIGCYILIKRKEK